jgi:hypothetical protein
MAIMGGVQSWLFVLDFRSESDPQTGKCQIILSMVLVFR